MLCIVGDSGGVAEGVPETMRQEEMRLREGELIWRRIAGVGRVEISPGGNPERAVSIKIAVFRFASGEDRRQLASRRLGLEDVEQARCERQLVALAGERMDST